MCSICGGPLLSPPLSDTLMPVAQLLTSDWRLTPDSWSLTRGSVAPFHSFSLLFAPASHWGNWTRLDNRIHDAAKYNELYAMTGTCGQRHQFDSLKREQKSPESATSQGNRAMMTGAQLADWVRDARERTFGSSHWVTPYGAPSRQRLAAAG